MSTKVVKLTFAKEARTSDPSRLFNPSLESDTRRTIDIHEGEMVDAGVFKALVKAAVALNGPPTKKRQTLKKFRTKFTLKGPSCTKRWLQNSEIIVIMPNFALGLHI